MLVYFVGKADKYEYTWKEYKKVVMDIDYEGKCGVDSPSVFTVIP